MKRTWVRFEAVMTQGSEGKMAALHQENPEGEKRSTERLKEALNCAVVNPKVKSMMKQGITLAHAGKITTAPAHTTAPRNHPACAGKTSARSSAESPRPDHPRVCGENSSISSRRALASGSPPHVREKLKRKRAKKDKRRITPAHAGKTEEVL